MLDSSWSGRTSEMTTSAPRLRSQSGALGFVRGYQRDLNPQPAAACERVQQDLARRGYGLTEVRILDLLIWSAQAAA